MAIPNDVNGAVVSMRTPSSGGARTGDVVAPLKVASAMVALAAPFAAGVNGTRIQVAEAGFVFPLGVGPEGNTYQAREKLITGRPGIM